MKIRLIAYRKPEASSTDTKAYNLDLQEAPNISLNFQFSDIKEPETRKANFSQTFKLPFTPDNNLFFQDWYNPNLETLIFSTRTKFPAILYIGSTPQFEGVIELKSVYKKAQYYEVVLMSNTATLFSVIGETRLKDVFKNSDDTYTDEYNHVFDQNQMQYSWDGTNNNFVNTAGATLRDDTVDVNKIMYPMSVTEPKFYFDPSQDRYMNMDQGEINTLGYNVASFWTVNISQFRPALQIKEIFKLILARAGYSYTSNFIDGDYFGKIYMTSCNHIEGGAVPTTNTNLSPSGLMFVGNNENWGEIIITNNDCSTDFVESELILPDNTPYVIVDGMSLPSDPDNIWDTTTNSFVKTDMNMMSLQIWHAFYWSNILKCSYFGSVTIAYLLQECLDDGTLVEESMFDVQQWNVNFMDDEPSGQVGLDQTLSLENMPVGARAKVIIKVVGIVRDDPALNGVLRLGQTGLFNSEFTAWAQINWMPYSTNIYGATVNVPSCIDPDLKQSDFLKDIVQRFNLVILTDPEDDTNLIIEPYNDFIASGEVKHWTEKLDTSKELIIKDTTDLQKKTIHFTDLEDVDILNNEIKEYMPEANVFGHLKIDEWNNEYAKGTLKNTSIFSPYVNSQIYLNGDTQSGTALSNVTIQYEFSVESDGENVNNPVKKTKPKLFFYRGQSTNALDLNGSLTNYYLHATDTANQTITAYLFNTYPVCTPFDIDTNTTSSLGSNTRSLYWNSTPPLVGNLTIFNSSFESGNWFNNALFGAYWKDYLNEIYSQDARIMEAYINLDAVDVFQFKFNNEYFIKDTYWRILKIHNYQVGANVSTKITFIKSLDTKENCNGCDYVLGTLSSGMNYVGTAMNNIGILAWCPDDDPTCNPDVSGPNFEGLYTSPECCECNGGMVQYNSTANANLNLYPCLAYSGSTPFRLANKQGLKALFNDGQSKGLLTGKIGGETKPVIFGSANSRYDTPMLPFNKDSIIIKYKNFKTNTPKINGESYKMILTGYTVGNTVSYAYPKGQEEQTPFRIPSNINMVMRIKGVATVVGGTSPTYPLGSTEAFAYYTGFVSRGNTLVQLGVLNGTNEWNLKEAGAISTCVLEITVTDSVLKFGIKDNDLETKRVWQLSVEMDVNSIVNMENEFDANYALFQNGQRIKFQNYDYLIWN